MREKIKTLILEAMTDELVDAIVSLVRSDTAGTMADLARRLNGNTVTVERIENASAYVAGLANGHAAPTPARPSRGQRGGRTVEATALCIANAAKMAKFVKANPGCSGALVMEKLGLNESTMKSTRMRAARDGTIRMTGAKSSAKYWPADADSVVDQFIQAVKANPGKGRKELMPDLTTHHWNATRYAALRTGKVKIQGTGPHSVYFPA